MTIFFGLASPRTGPGHWLRCGRGRVLSSGRVARAHRQSHRARGTEMIDLYPDNY